MTKEMLKGLIELVSEEDIERADKSIAKNGTVPHDAVDWD